MVSILYTVHGNVTTLLTAQKRQINESTDKEEEEDTQYEILVQTEEQRSRNRRNIE